MWHWASGHPEEFCIIAVTALLWLYGCVQVLMGWLKRIGWTFPGTMHCKSIDISGPKDDSVEEYNAFVDRFNSEIEKLRMEKRIKN